MIESCHRRANGPSSRPTGARIRQSLAFSSLLILAACVRSDPRPPAPLPPVEQPPAPQPPAPQLVPLPPPPPPPPPPSPLPANAVLAGVTLAPAPLEISPEAAVRAYRAFRITCPSLLTRQDTSGLTRQEDWRPLCETDLSNQSPATLADFFRHRFDLVQVGDGRALATGYYEPQIRGSRVRAPGYDVPVYAKPRDLLETHPLTGARARGRIDQTGAFVPYHDRAAIEAGALAGRGLEIAWAADPIDLFFLEIQGSGRLLLPDGNVMRIGYAGQNGREYVAIGRLLRDRGLLPSPVTMQAIVEWMRANPEQGRALMRENKSFIFFQELTGPGPLGALGRPVTPRVTVAADPRYVPLGAPVLLSEMQNPIANGLWVAQDTGGAIRGTNRFDTFWGAGEEAAAISGPMQILGRALILLPRGAIERIAARGAPPQR